LVITKTIKQPKGYATMNKNSVIELEGRAVSTDPFSERQLSGSPKLIYQVVEAKLYACLEP
jgi:hypothetical protein